MIQLLFKLVKMGPSSCGTTVIRLYDRIRQYNCLFDTGAGLAVWCAGMDEFMLRFPDACDTRYVAPIGGFGSGYSMAPIYEIPDYIISDGKNSVCIKKLPVAVIDRDFSFDMIIGFGVLESVANIAISTYDEKKEQTITPYITIDFRRNVLFSSFIPVERRALTEKQIDYLDKNDRKGFFDRISIFYSE